MEARLTRVRKPEGGYRFITAEQLFMAWWCYRTKTIRLFDLRIWFALHEVVSRRCQKRKARKAQFEVAEIGELVGCSDEKAIRVGLRRLEACSLVMWSEERVAFGKSAGDLRLSDSTAYYEAFGKITNRRRRVPVPRRILRMVSAGARSTLIATTIGHLLRLAYCRSGECRLDGCCKSSWLADVFGVDVRSVKTARAYLIEIGWLRPEEMPQWYLNRYGWRGAVNPTWNDSVVEKRSPQIHRKDTKRSPLREYKKLSSRTCTNQKLAERDPGGVCKKRWLKNVNAKDLVCQKGRRALFRRAVESGIVSNDGASFRYFVAAAERSRRLATRNPAGMFAWLVSNRCWGHLSDVDLNATKRRRADAREHKPALRRRSSGNSFVPAHEAKPQPGLQSVTDILASLRPAHSPHTSRKADAPSHHAPSLLHCLEVDTEATLR